jgi:tetratricopeptide (TPR) repeat protein
MNKAKKVKEAVGMFIILFAATVLALADDAQPKVFADRAKAAYDRARSAYESNTNDPVAAWNFGRTCYDWADFSETKSQRGAIAYEGMAACHQSLSLTNSAGAHYYLALNMGQLAQAEMLEGRKLVREMVPEFEAVAELDPHFDYAGPERGLGLIYRDAPGWPLSIGDHAKAVEYLEKAATLEPDYPENYLNLAETYLKSGGRAKVKKNMDALDVLWPKAQKNLTGVEWEQSWQDWSKRRDDVREKMAQM